MRTMRSCAFVALLSLEPSSAAFVGGVAAARPRASPSMVIGEQATSFGPAQAIRKLKEELPQFPFLAEGDGNPSAPREAVESSAASIEACTRSAFAPLVPVCPCSASESCI